MDDETVATPNQQPQGQPLEYEETPIIPPIPEEQPTQDAPLSAVPVKKSGFSFGGLIKNIILFAILFGVGFYLSGYIRTWISTLSVSTSPKVAPTPVAMPNDIAADFFATTSAEGTLIPKTVQWQKQTVLNGATRIAIPDVSYTLPDTMLAPLCDGASCASQGTYLPGGTRFTVAARGTGQALVDYRRKVISDAAGKPLVTKQTTIAGKTAVEFTSALSGTTVGGYVFTRIRGYMIELSPSLSLEINHFAPAGITTNFMEDDVLFDKIVQTLTFPGAVTNSLEKGMEIPLTATATPIVTMSPTPTIETFAPIR